MPARRTLLFTLFLACVAILAAGCDRGGGHGEDMVLVSTQDGDYALFGIARDGSDRGRLTDEKGDPSTTVGLLFQISPAWSPDARQIAFASSREGSLDIYVMAADGSGDPERLTSTKENDEHPTWSPDGKRIAFQRSDGHLYVMNADGSGARRVTSSLSPQADPAWSPDGRWLAFTQRTPGTPIREIWLMTPDGTNVRQVTRLNAQNYTPAWAPDGRTIAFASDHEGPRYGIFTIGIDGRGLREVTPATGSDAFEPAWSPDGTLIAFSRDGSIVTVDRQGKETVLTDAANNDSSPAWRPVTSDEEGS